MHDNNSVLAKNDCEKALAKSNVIMYDNKVNVYIGWEKCIGESLLYMFYHMNEDGTVVSSFLFLNTGSISFM